MERHDSQTDQGSNGVETTDTQNPLKANVTTARKPPQTTKRKTKNGKIRRPANVRVRTKQRENRFLNSLRTGASTYVAAEAAGIARTTAYQWRDADPAFRQAWEDAVNAGTDLLEQEAWRRAHDGNTEPVYHRGEIVGHVRKYSDALTMFLLKGRRPEKYNDRKEITGAGGGPLQVDSVSDLELARQLAFILALGEEEVIETTATEITD